MVSIAWAATLGIGVMFSAIPLLLYQGGLTLLAQQLEPILTPAVIDALTAVGGTLLIFTGSNLMGLTRISVLNYLPGIIIGAAAAKFFWF